MTLLNSAVGIANGGPSAMSVTAAALAPSSGERSSASSSSDARPLCAASDGGQLSIELPAYGVRATFSPRGLEALQQAAQSVASEAGELVEQIGDSAVEIIESAQALVQGVAQTVGETVSDSAQVLIAGSEAAQSGVQQLAREAESLVSQSLSKAGDAAGAALGYGAVATLAGQALLSAMA